MLAYTDLDRLVECCGEHQPWLAVRIDALMADLRDQRLPGPVVNLPLSQDVRWGAEGPPWDLAALAAAARGARGDPDRGGPRRAARGRRLSSARPPNRSARDRGTPGDPRRCGAAERERVARAGRGGLGGALGKLASELDHVSTHLSGTAAEYEETERMLAAWFVPGGSSMGSLGLHADPDGWLNAGYSVRTLMDSLDSELYDADGTAARGCPRTGPGRSRRPSTGHWSGLRSRAEDLIAQGRRAAAAITDFGGRLEDFVKRAADLESYWLSFGLQIGLDGMHFALPWGLEQLSPEHQVSFHQWLTESERDVTAMWSDIRAAVDDVVTALESLIAAFEDYAVLELGAAAGLVGGDLGGYRDKLGQRCEATG